MTKKLNPRMHSAEHILNQTMVRMFNCGRCISAHIEEKKSKCDYQFNRNLTKQEVEQIDKQVNEVIRTNAPITEEWISRAEAAERYQLNRLPSAVGDKIRIVKVGDYDACPCIGPHIGSTGDIGQFRISTTSYEDGILRIRFKLVK
jgi:misacylated tRNA(Ala) deacylase